MISSAPATRRHIPRRSTRPNAPLSAAELDVLLAVALGWCHGSLIAGVINDRQLFSHSVTESAVYTAIRMLEGDGSIESCACKHQATQGQLRCFELTQAGRLRAQQEARRLEAVLAVSREAGVVPAD